MKASDNSSASCFEGARPSPSRHLMPFHGVGLCEAVMIIPPSALSDFYVVILRLCLNLFLSGEQQLR